MYKQPLIILTGPTASGKTELSVKLAKAVNGEIISADSIQVYKYMDIGSAKATVEEMDGIRHYLISELDPADEFNIYVFRKKAKEYINEIYSKGKVPIIVGGTGFYIQSVLYDIEFSDEDNDKQYRNMLSELAKVKGEKYLHDRLREIDGKAADNIHMNNVKRVIRALEYYHITGKKISEHNEEQRKKESPYEFKYYVLNMDRKLLYERINLRVDNMLKNGLLEEVKLLLEKGYDKSLVSMQGIGYKEMIAYINGEMGYEEAVETLKKNTRHFAKRQLTWFRREENATFITYEDFGMDKEKILFYLTEDVKKMID